MAITTRRLTTGGLALDMSVAYNHPLITGAERGVLFCHGRLGNAIGAGQQTEYWDILTASHGPLGPTGWPVAFPLAVDFQNPLDLPQGASGFNNADGGRRAVVRALVEAGYVVGVVNMGGVAGSFRYGNSTCLAWMATAIAVLQASADPAIGGFGCSAKVAFMSYSGGAWSALNYALGGNAQVAGIAMNAPALNLPFYRGTDAVPGPLYAEINTAFVALAPAGTDAQFIASVYPTKDPVTWIAGTPAVQQLPACAFYNAGDVSAVPASNVLTIAPLWPTLAVAQEGGLAVGHGDWTTPYSALVSFLNRLTYQ